MCVCPQYEGQFTVFSNSFSGLTFSENAVLGFISQSFLKKIVKSRNSVSEIFTLLLTH